jgi:hypothetical protein
MVATSGAVGVDPYVGYCARLRRELSGEPDVGNLHLRFDEGRGTCSVPSYSTGSDCFSDSISEPRPKGDGPAVIATETE